MSFTADILGKTIIGPDGNAIPDRKYCKFRGSVEVSDESGMSMVDVGDETATYHLSRTSSGASWATVATYAVGSGESIYLEVWSRAKNADQTLLFERRFDAGAFRPLGTSSLVTGSLSTTGTRAYYGSGPSAWDCRSNTSGTNLIVECYGSGSVATEWEVIVRVRRFDWSW